MFPCLCLQKGNTALHIASLAGHEDIVKMLVEHDAKINVQAQVSYVLVRGEFNKFVGLTHRLEDGFNIIFQYNSPLLQCIWPTFLLSSLCL